MRKPKALCPGDTLGFVAPSSPPKSPESVDRAVRAARDRGYRVVVGDSCRAVHGYLAGEDALRANDLNRMFADDSVDAVIAIRGGYGAPRILDRLDYDLAARNPKILAGYSDITALHLAYGQKSGLVTFHAPMPTTEQIFDEADGFTGAGFWKTLASTEPLGRIENPDGFPVTCVHGGIAKGPLKGGNLCLIAALNGTPYELDAHGAILVLEDIDEYIHRLDRMLTTLRLSGKFDECAGIILGGFTNCNPENPDWSLTLSQIVEEILVPCGKPILAGMMIGHCDPKITLPFGVEATLDAGKGSLMIDEPALVPR